MFAALQRCKLNMFYLREGLFSPRALVSGNPALAKLAAENPLKMAPKLSNLCSMITIAGHCFSVITQVCTIGHCMIGRKPLPSLT